MVKWKDIIIVDKHPLISQAMKGAFNKDPYHLVTTPSEMCE